MDDYTPPSPPAGMSAADCQELAQRRAEERRQMQARIEALEASEQESQARIEALEAAIVSQDDATSSPKSQKAATGPNGGVPVRPKAPAGGQQKIQRRFL